MKSVNKQSREPQTIGETVVYAHRAVGRAMPDHWSMIPCYTSASHAALMLGVEAIEGHEVVKATIEPVEVA